MTPTPETNQPQPPDVIPRGLTRRNLLRGGAATAALVAVTGGLELMSLIGEVPTVDPIDPSQFGLYGMRAHQSLQDAYAITDKGRAGLYWSHYPVGGNIADNWMFSHAMAATLDTAGAKEADERHSEALQISLNGLSYYWYEIADGNAPAGYQAKVVRGNGDSDKYYDDNAWSGLNLVRAGRQEEDEQLFDRAQEVFRFVLSGTSGEDSCAPKGAHWVESGNKASADINTVSNAPNAQLGIRLYTLTGKEAYAAEAIRMYDWVEAYMLDPKDGLYWDRIDKRCHINKMKWSYNQGTMIGANLFLADIKNDSDYLKKAEHIAKASMRLYNTDGVTDLTGQPLEFNAIYVRNLLLLSQKTQDPTLRTKIRETAETYAQAIWPKFFTHQRNIRFYDAYPLVQQAAIVEILSMLGWDSQQYDMLV